MIAAYEGASGLLSEFRRLLSNPRTMCCKRASGTEANTRALASVLCVVCRGSAERKHLKETNVNPRNPQTLSAPLTTR